MPACTTLAIVIGWAGAAAPRPAVAMQPATDDARERERDERLDALERRVEELEADNEQLRGEQELAAEEAAVQRERAHRRFGVRAGGYVDVGLFWAQDDGSGTRSDLGHRLFPEYDGLVPDRWVFVGDPLSTAVNARGEPADTGDSQALAFDSIDSGGGTTFLVNAVNVSLSATLGEQVAAFAMADFVPRTRDPSVSTATAMGDFVDVKLAYLRWDVPVRRFDFELYGGKVDPVVGREYRIQESPHRTEVTPSLVCRYTCGRPVGLKARWLFFDRRFVLAASATNGSAFRESFGFANEIDRNRFKTLAGRVSYEIPVGAGLEIGASGQYGAQDLQRDDDIRQWSYGFDAHLDVRGLELTGEFVRARADGSGPRGPGIARCGGAACIQALGAYLTAGYRALNWFMPFVRVDWRDARHERGASFAYITQTTRISPGARFELTPNLLLKAMYTVNLEVDEVPQIPNDTLTTALVGHF